MPELRFLGAPRVVSRHGPSIARRSYALSLPGPGTAPESGSVGDALESQLAGTGKAAKARLSRARWLAALGGLLAGLVAFGAGEAVYKRIAPELVLQTFRGRRLMLSTYATENTAAA